MKKAMREFPIPKSLSKKKKKEKSLTAGGIGPICALQHKRAQPTGWTPRGGGEKRESKGKAREKILRAGKEKKGGGGGGKGRRVRPSAWMPLLEYHLPAAALIGSSDLSINPSTLTLPWGTSALVAAAAELSFVAVLGSFTGSSSFEAEAEA